MIPTMPQAKTILLVEDEALLAFAASRLLQRSGYEVVLAYESQEAIEKARHLPDNSLLLIDINLGSDGMDGVQLAHQILQERQAALVFLSGHIDQGTVESIAGLTAHGYVVKGSGEANLLTSIHMAFRLYETERRHAAEVAQLKQALAELQQRLDHKTT
jgi:CheY-like chemotaxis protein